MNQKYVPLRLKVNKFTRNGLLIIDILNGDQYQNAKEPTRRLLPADEKLDELEFNIGNHLNFVLIS